MAEHCNLMETWVFFFFLVNETNNKENTYMQNTVGLILLVLM